MKHLSKWDLIKLRLSILWKQTFSSAWIRRNTMFMLGSYYSQTGNDLSYINLDNIEVKNSCFSLTICLYEKENFPYKEYPILKDSMLWYISQQELMVKPTWKKVKMVVIPFSSDTKSLDVVDKLWYPISCDCL